MHRKVALYMCFLHLSLVYVKAIYAMNFPINKVAAGHISSDEKPSNQIVAPSQTNKTFPDYNRQI